MKKKPRHQQPVTKQKVKAAPPLLPSKMFLGPDHCTMQLGPQEFRFNYADVAPLREMVQDFILDLVEGQRHGLFRGDCGRCGNSCRRDDVLVREQEILPLQQQLGISESEFRQRYLAPAATWNPGDGLIRLKDGACPFLVQVPGQPTGSPNSATCSVHELRPQNCRDYSSDKPHCHKDSGHLVQRLKEVWVDGQNTRMVLVGGETGTYPTSPNWWSKLSQVSLESRPSDRQRFLQAGREIKAMLENLLSKSSQPDADDDYRSNCKSMRRLLEEMGTIQHLAADTSELEGAWTLLRRLEHSVNHQQQSQVALESQVAGQIAWLRLEEQGLQMRLGGQPEIIKLAYHSHIQVQQAAGVLMQSVLRQEDGALQESLRENDPPCYMCGECCRVYLVEIKPSDITRLSHYYQISPAQFVEDYTQPPRFNWNKQNRILAKVEAPIYDKNLKSLRILGQEEERKKQCIFLERREDNFFYCSVHSHKPDVCRAYGASNTLCRTTNQRENWGRQAKSLVALEVTPERVSLCLQADRVIPYSRDFWPEVAEAIDQLEAVLRLQASRA